MRPERVVSELPRNAPRPPYAERAERSTIEAMPGLPTYENNERREPTAGAPRSADEMVAAADLVLAAAQSLRRSVQQTSEPSGPFLASLEATLDSLGVSLAELRGPLLEEVARRHRRYGSRTAQLDTARLAARANEHLAEAAAACGELRALLVGPGAEPHGWPGSGLDEAAPDGVAREFDAVAHP